MAELNTGGGGGKGGKVRSKKSNPGVDLTAMVDLAFLLITFFILTTTLSKPQSMDLSLPDNDKPKPDAIPPEAPAWRTLTVVLGNNNKLVYYIGLTDTPYVDADIDGKPKLENYGGKGIRKAILAHNKYVLEHVDDPNKEGLTVLIKASKSANYKNVVDILDEMAIIKPRSYSIVDVTPGDIKMLEDKKIK
jgi:biopolymer transport protein ExbD